MTVSKHPKNAQTDLKKRGHAQLVLKQRKIVDFKHQRYKTLQSVPFCTYLGGYPSNQ